MTIDFRIDRTDGELVEDASLEIREGLRCHFAVVYSYYSVLLSQRRRLVAAKAQGLPRNWFHLSMPNNKYDKSWVGIESYRVCWDGHNQQYHTTTCMRTEGKVTSLIIISRCLRLAVTLILLFNCLRSGFEGVTMTLTSGGRTLGARIAKGHTHRRSEKI